MGFFEILGELLGNAKDQLIEKTERIEKYRRYYSRYSDRELFEKRKYLTGDELLGCIKVLRDRGYGSNQND